MNFLTSLQADRLIAQIREEGDPSSANGKKLFAKLGKLGTGAVPKILEALASADKRQTVEYVELLSSLVSDKTLPLITRGLADGDPRTVSGTAWALSSNKKFNVNRLVDLLGEDEYSKAAIVEVLQAHKDRLNIRQLLAQIYFLQPSEKAAVFKLIDEVTTEDMVPDLLARMDGKDPLVKTHLINVLARFDRPDVNKALQEALRDTNKLVRGAALAGIVRSKTTVDVALDRRLAARPRPRRHEQGRRRHHPAQSSGDREVPDRRPEGRERVQPALGRRGAERDRHDSQHQVPARSRSRRRLVGALARLRRSWRASAASASSPPCSS